MGVLAMFPLGSVLLPGELLPLEVFEPRYRQLVLDLLADDVNEPEFGVTLIERGHEVGGGDQRSEVGTVARIVRIDALDDGRYALVAVGMRRLRVNAWLPDDPYPMADVDEWPDDEASDPDVAVQLAAARVRVEATRRLAAELGDLGEPGDAEFPELVDDPTLASYQLVSLAPVGAADRLRLLAAESPMRRLELLDEALDDAEAVLRFRST
ncbi:LON peptidase substrate-binding domain-containing protein [soil metagenome]